MGQISVHVDITTTPGTGEHKVTVKGTFWIQIGQTAHQTLISAKLILKCHFICVWICVLNYFMGLECLPEPELLFKNKYIPQIINLCNLKYLNTLVITFQNCIFSMINPIMYIILVLWLAYYSHNLPNSFSRLFSTTDLIFSWWFNLLVYIVKISPECKDHFRHEIKWFIFCLIEPKKRQRFHTDIC